MHIFNISAHHTKNFMHTLLKTDLFDAFAMRRAEIHNVAAFNLECENNTWAVLRPFVFHIVKEGGKPSLVKIVLAHAEPAALHPNAAALFLNIQYDNNAVSCTSATAQKEFALNKELDNLWDEWVTQFFIHHNIALSPAESRNAT